MSRALLQAMLAGGSSPALTVAPPAWTPAAARSAVPLWRDKPLGAKVLADHGYSHENHPDGYPLDDLPLGGQAPVLQRLTEYHTAQIVIVDDDQAESAYGSFYLRHVRRHGHSVAWSLF
jgi:hypothetical protein